MEVNLLFCIFVLTLHFIFNKERVEIILNMPFLFTFLMTLLQSSELNFIMRFSAQWTGDKYLIYAVLISSFCLIVPDGNVSTIVDENG